MPQNAVKFKTPGIAWINDDLASWFIDLNMQHQAPIGLRQNDHYFADNILKCIFWNGNVFILIKDWLKFVPKVPINNNPVLVQIMAWSQVGAEQVTSHYLNQRWPSLLTQVRIPQTQCIKQFSYNQWFPGSHKWLNSFITCDMKW